MTKALVFLLPLTFALAMGLWLRHVRQAGGHRWITHWLVTLAPLGLLAGLHSIGLINNAVAEVLMVPTVLGVAALLAIGSPTVRMGMVNAGGGLRGRTKSHSEPDEEESDPGYIRNQIRADMGIYDHHNRYLDDD